MQNPGIATLFNLHSANTSAARKKVARRRIRLVRDRTSERFHVDENDVDLNPI